MAYKGKYLPKNLSKYIGDPTKIIYRSLLERRVMVWLDKTPQVKEWQSELVVIKYVSPIDNKVHRYYVDFSMRYINNKGELKSALIEVKPEKQTKAPRLSNTKTGKQTRRYIKEQYTWKVNEAKWTYARQWCLSNGYTFQIWNEKTIDLVTGLRKKH